MTCQKFEAISNASNVKKKRGGGAEFWYTGNSKLDNNFL